MATGSPKTNPSGGLEADIEQLKADIAKLAEQLRATGRHSYGTAKRAAAEGSDRAWSESEAAIESLRASANDIERQVISSVREKPMTALAIAAGLGFLFALFARR